MGRPKAALEARHIDLFSRYFHALAEAPGPVLIHCAGGKDRTGILAALTHHIAGVMRQDIVEDYLHTNRPETFERAAKEARPQGCRRVPCRVYGVYQMGDV